MVRIPHCLLRWKNSSIGVVDQFTVVLDKTLLWEMIKGNMQEKKSLQGSKEVALCEFQDSYLRDVSPYESKIKALLAGVNAGKMKAKSTDGWLIAKKVLYVEIDKPWGEHDEETDYYISLRPNGVIELTTKVSYSDIRYKMGQETTSTCSSETHVCSLEEAMAETDFSADYYIGNTSEEGYSFWHTTRVYDLNTKWERGQLLRRNTIKGEALYNILKDILNMGAGYAERKKLYAEAMKTAESKDSTPKKTDKKSWNVGHILFLLCLLALSAFGIPLLLNLPKLCALEKGLNPFVVGVWIIPFILTLIFEKTGNWPSKVGAWYCAAMAVVFECAIFSLGNLDNIGMTIILWLVAFAYGSACFIKANNEVGNVVSRLSLGSFFVFCVAGGLIAIKVTGSEMKDWTYWLAVGPALVDVLAAIIYSIFAPNKNT